MTVQLSESFPTLLGAFAWSIFFIFALPFVAFADTLGSTSEIERFLQRILGILNVLLPIVVTLAALAFFWGLLKYLWAGADEKARESGKAFMIWGVIALFVMISVWGLVQTIGAVFGVGQGGSAPVPSVDRVPGGTGIGSGFGGTGGGGSI